MQKIFVNYTKVLNNSWRVTAFPCTSFSNRGRDTGAVTPRRASVLCGEPWKWGLRWGLLCA